MRCVTEHLIKAGGKYVDKEKALEIINVGIEQLKGGSSLADVKSMCVFWNAL